MDVLRGKPHEAAARLLEGHPHCTTFPCNAVKAMLLLRLTGRRGGRAAYLARQGAGNLVVELSVTSNRA